jgi:hypothetical protein
MLNQPEYLLLKTKIGVSLPSYLQQPVLKSTPHLLKIHRNGAKKLSEATYSWTAISTRNSLMNKTSLNGAAIIPLQLG